MIKKWIELSYLSSRQDFVSKNIKFKTSILRSDLCDYSDAYIIFKGTISVEGDNDVKKEIKN